MSVSYRPHILFTAQAAATGDAVQLDYRFDGTQARMVYCTKNTADTIAIELSPDGTSFFSYYTFAAGVTSASVSVLGPAMQLRVVKTGSAAVCNVILLG